MAIARNLERFLEKNQIDYTLINHDNAYTGSQLAHAEHISGKKVVKAVVVFIDDNPEMFVLPVVRKIDFRKLKNCLNYTCATFADEMDLATLFPDIEVGAIPPFGSLYALPCYIDQSIIHEDEIAFYAGNHHQSIIIDSAAYFKHEKAKVLNFSAPIEDSQITI